MQRCWLALALLVFPLAAQQAQLDVDPRVFSVLAAINAAGFDADADSPNNHPLRAEVKKYILAKNPPVLADLKSFFAKHRRRDSGSELSQYLSFALAVDAPPSFQWRFPGGEVPPDAAVLEGFGALMARFHQEADIDTVYRRCQPMFDALLESYQAPATRVMTEVDGYLRVSTIGARGRSFRIFLAPLAPPSQTHVRQYLDEMTIVFTPAATVDSAAIRNAYLHFQLEPNFLRHQPLVLKKRSLIDFVQTAGALDDRYKEDFPLLAETSLLKAIEARLAPLGQRAGMVEKALQEGFLLAPAFAELLPAYEKQEQSMRLYFPELINSIDLKKESQRLEKVEFLKEKPAGKALPREKAPELTGARKTLEEAEDRYASRELAPARELFLRSLKETDESYLHARAYYGLARIAALEKNLDLAEKLFQKTIDLGPEPPVKAWTYFYMGRLSEAAGEMKQAAAYYQQVLSLEGASMAARKAAEKALVEARREK
ncbi:MAG: tetratricopeptide repeat protein [Bryobacter sp.]|nr:tetratricopeptide repeat protein [Bryobacter sp.]